MALSSGEAMLLLVGAVVAVVAMAQLRRTPAPTPVPTPITPPVALPVASPAALPVVSHAAPTTAAAATATVASVMQGALKGAPSGAGNWKVPVGLAKAFATSAGKAQDWFQNQVAGFVELEPQAQGGGALRLPTAPPTLWNVVAQTAWQSASAPTPENALMPTVLLAQPPSNASAEWAQQLPTQNMTIYGKKVIDKASSGATLGFNLLSLASALNPGKFGSDVLNPPFDVKGCVAGCYNGPEATCCNTNIQLLPLGADASDCGGAGAGGCLACPPGDFEPIIAGQPFQTTQGMMVPYMCRGTCPKDASGAVCSGHGSCVASAANIACACDGGWTGAECEEAAFGWCVAGGSSSPGSQKPPYLNDQCATGYYAAVTAETACGGLFGQDCVVNGCACVSATDTASWGCNGVQGVACPQATDGATSTGKCAQDSDCHCNEEDGKDGICSFQPDGKPCGPKDKDCLWWCGCDTATGTCKPCYHGYNWVWSTAPDVGNAATWMPT